MTNDRFESPYLIRAEDLAAELDDPALRLYDCTTRLVPDPEKYMRAESCAEAYAAAHIPGAAYIDLQGRLSDTTQPWRFMMPAPGDLARRYVDLGIGPGARVVVYDTNGMMWSTRIWWMLRALGFDDVRVLDGGLKNWKAEGRALSDESASYPPADPIVPTPRPGMFCDQGAVLAFMDEKPGALLNALTTEQHAGGGIHYGRPGRISGSVNVPARGLTDPDTGLLKPAGELRRMFADAGVDPAKPVLCYCGGGIAATLDSFVLTLMGAEKVSVYDASLSEWAQNPDLPMETD